MDQNQIKSWMFSIKESKVDNLDYSRTENRIYAVK